MEATRVSQPVASALDGRVSRCPKCASFTYDVAGLSDEEVRRLVLETEGRVLNRLVLRTDGRGMSVDCGHGTVRPPSRWRRPVLRALVVTLLVAAAVSGVARLRYESRPPLMGDLDPNRPRPEYDPSFFAREAERRAADPAASATPPVVAEDWAPGTDRGREVHSTSEWVPQPVLDQHGEPITRTISRGGPEWDGPLIVDMHLSDVSASWNRHEVSSAQLVETIEAQLDPVRRCYGEALRINRHYRGTLTTHLSVEKDGTVSRVSMPQRTNKAPNARLQQCVEGALKGMRFERRSSASVSFRLIFAGAR
ncbi:MAG: AgmX/PglI C-terminal domain-containing protein [Myxococcales bacterium]|nr:AgmX/PglI C-terminal domain-containing protein [Myxococcales bacterium]